MFHPFEIAFCGLSGSGKTTLLVKVLRHFRQAGHEPAYFKHGCHRFDIDRQGKDSFLARQAGAVSVMISDPEKEALISDGSGSISQSSALLPCDMLFIEGLKELPIPKMLLVDPSGSILELLESGRISNVIALVHASDQAGIDRFGVPLFHRDDLAGITGFIQRHLDGQAAEIPLYGLVLAGGRSSRMGEDKAMLNYRQENQLLTTASLLEGSCSRVFVSCRQEQAEEYCRFGLPVITDSYLDIGPMGGLLSAQRIHPGAAWLIAACDFPFMDAGTIEALSSSRDPFRFATAFLGPDTGRPEPLLTIYEPKSRMKILQQHAAGNDSLSSFLMRSRSMIVEPEYPAALRNINDKTGMTEALRQRTSKGPPLQG
jgi:molybdopterin-guanine dinucleotide biosynthesis protein A